MTADEQWRHDVVTGIARLLDVLQDISDSIEAGGQVDGDETVVQTPADDDLLTTRETAGVTNVPEATLRYWRHLGAGPKSSGSAPASDVPPVRRRRLIASQYETPT